MLADMCHIAALPEELIEIILNLVKDTSTKETFWNAVQTCHQWRRIGLGLYRNLGFAVDTTIDSTQRRYKIREYHETDRADVTCDLDFSPPSRLYLSLLSTLTIHVHHCRTLIPRNNPTRDFIAGLKDTLRHTWRLSTFSLKLSDGWDYPSLDVPALPQSFLSGVVAVLPSTVVNLEIDAATVDVPPANATIDIGCKGHLCHQIAEILRRLRHLRLRVGHICETLLGRDASSNSCRKPTKCDFCAVEEHRTCALIQSWKMCSMIVWLPWNQTAQTNTFLRAAGPLLDPALHNPTIIMVVHQTSHSSADLSTTNDSSSRAYNSFTWTPQSNVPAALRERLATFNFRPVTGRTPRTSSSPHQTHASSLCAEHAILTTPQSRVFYLSPTRGPRPDPGTTSPFPYMADRTVEAGLTWTQHAHASYRYPVAELTDSTAADSISSVGTCLFPGCKDRAKSLLHLRGHHMYAHPESPHGQPWEGRVPCPSQGCERIGVMGFKDRDEVIEHLQGHHARVCTL